MKIKWKNEMKFVLRALHFAFCESCWFKFIFLHLYFLYVRSLEMDVASDSQSNTGMSDILYNMLHKLYKVFSDTTIFCK